MIDIQKMTIRELDYLLCDTEASGQNPHCVQELIKMELLRRLRGGLLDV